MSTEKSSKLRGSGRSSSLETFSSAKMPNFWRPRTISSDRDYSENRSKSSTRYSWRRKGAPDWLGKRSCKSRSAFWRSSSERRLRLWPYPDAFRWRSRFNSRKRLKDRTPTCSKNREIKKNWKKN